VISVASMLSTMIAGNNKSKASSATQPKQDTEAMVTYMTKKVLDTDNGFSD